MADPAKVVGGSEVVVDGPEATLDLEVELLD